MFAVAHSVDSQTYLSRSLYNARLQPQGELHLSANWQPPASPVAQVRPAFPTGKPSPPCLGLSVASSTTKTGMTMARSKGVVGIERFQRRDRSGGAMRLIRQRASELCALSFAVSWFHER